MAATLAASYALPSAPGEAARREIRRHAEALTLRPRVGHGQPVAPIAFWHLEAVEDDEVAQRAFCVPRAYGLKHLPAPADVRVSDGVPMADAVHFRGTLIDGYPPQRAAVDRVLAKLRAVTAPMPCPGGILVLPCGFGKTVVALAVACALGRRTLILVHREPLADQTCRRIAQFVGGAPRVGRLQADKVQVDDTDFVVGLVQSVSRPGRYPPALLRTFGLVIVDEAHHMCARQFSRCFRVLPARHRLGLSATPERPDGLTPALGWHFGPVLFRAARVFEQVDVEQLHYRTPKPMREIRSRGGAPLVPCMINRLVGDRVRNAILVARIVAAARAGRHVLVLSDRLEHLRALRKSFEEACPQVPAALYIGGQKPDAYSAAIRCPVLFGSYGMASEGMDVPRLDTLVLATPRARVEQAVGRVLRAHPDKPTPWVVDLVDPVGVFVGYARRRRRLYDDTQYRVLVRSVRSAADAAEWPPTGTLPVDPEPPAPALPITRTPSGDIRDCFALG